MGGLCDSPDPDGDARRTDGHADINPDFDADSDRDYYADSDADAHADYDADDAPGGRDLRQYYFRGARMGD
jgi:hypothetical protein